MSVAGRVPSGRELPIAAYVASKHATVGLVRQMAVELVKYGILANCVMPGTVDTPMQDRLLRASGALLGETYEQTRARTEAMIPVGRLETPGGCGRDGRLPGERRRPLLGRSMFRCERRRLVLLMDPRVLTALAGFDSATIANAIERFDVRDRLEGYTSLELRCQFPELPPVVGYAVTATAEWTSGRDDLDTGWAGLLDAIDTAPRPAIVVIGWDGPDTTTGCVVGDMVATGLDRIGVVGIATDLAIRDRSGMRRRAPKMQVFARGTVSSHGRTHLVRIGQPAVVGGLRIAPGALLHGDENGLVEVPLDIAERVPAVAEEVRAAEEAYFSAMSGPGVEFRDVREFLDPGH